MAPKADPEGYYSCLSADSCSSSEEIRATYRRLALRYHPDKNPGTEAAAAEAFCRLQSAYAVLGDVAKRLAYDQRCGSSRARSTKRPRPRTPPKPRTAPSPPAPSCQNFFCESTGGLGSAAATGGYCVPRVPQPYASVPRAPRQAPTAANSNGCSKEHRWPSGAPRLSPASLYLNANDVDFGRGSRHSSKEFTRDPKDAWNFNYDGDTVWCGPCGAAHVSCCAV